MPLDWSRLLHTAWLWRNVARARSYCQAVPTGAARPVTAQENASPTIYCGEELGASVPLAAGRSHLRCSQRRVRFFGAKRRFRSTAVADRWASRGGSVGAATSTSTSSGTSACRTVRETGRRIQPLSVDIVSAHSCHGCCSHYGWRRAGPPRIKGRQFSARH